MSNGREGHLQPITPGGADLRRQPVRDHIFHGITRSLCPECLRVVDAQVLIKDGAVFLRKHCQVHGWHQALVSSDAEWYLGSSRYNRPGALPFGFATTVGAGCPLDCGLCGEHQQHTCVAVIEVTTRCNLACPTCLASVDQAGCDLSVSEVEAMLDRLVEREGNPEVVQLSGGEPTLHPRIMEILAAVRARGIQHVILNTNGLRLAQDAGYVHRLAQFEPVIYLQFDGLRAYTHRQLRGRDLRETKFNALENLRKAGIKVQLVATVARGVNDGEVGEILRFGLADPAVVGVSYQPVAYAGRCLGSTHPLQRVTLTDVLHAVEEQTDGLFRVTDFRPVPCPHPTCAACTYAIVRGQQVIPIPRLLNVDYHLNMVTNRLLPDLSDGLPPALQTLWSMSAVVGTDRTNRALACCVADRLPPPERTGGMLSERFFMVHVHGFMDRHTLDIQRLMKCCVHELLPDGRAIPFCAYNVMGYREQVRREQESRAQL